MGPIGTVRKSFIPFGYSSGNIHMQLTHIRRVNRNKEMLTALVTVKYGEKHVTESAKLTWNAEIKAFGLEDIYI